MTPEQIQEARARGYGVRQWKGMECVSDQCEQGKHPCPTPGICNGSTTPLIEREELPAENWIAGAIFALCALLILVTVTASLIN